MGINLKLFCEFKSPSTYEKKLALQPSTFCLFSFNSTPFHALGKAKNAFLTTTL